MRVESRRHRPSQLLPSLLLVDSVVIMDQEFIEVQLTGFELRLRLQEAQNWSAYEIINRELHTMFAGFIKAGCWLAESDPNMVVCSTTNSR